MKQEDGHFTILEGSCEAIKFDDNSMILDDLLQSIKTKNWSCARKIVELVQNYAKIPLMSGFGESDTNYNNKRTLTIVAARNSNLPCVLLILPKDVFQGMN